MADRQLVYIGNYTKGEDAAIYHAEVDLASGALKILGETKCEDAPSYLALHPTGRYLYLVSEVNSHDGGGAVSAFAIDPDSGDLTFLNLQPTGGSPCHNTVDATGRFVLCANYGGGNVAMHPIAADGSLGEMSDFRQHEGSSVNPDRQQEPHAHSINIDPYNRFAFCADLGLDQVIIYDLDLEGGKLKDHDAAAVTGGAGPRHLAMHPNGGQAYVINEISNTITVFDWNEAAGSLREIQEISTVPGDFSGSSHTADIHITPDGRYLYGSNRGHDSIAIYSIGNGGQLALLGYQQVPANPRNFVLSPDGAYLYSGSQNDNTIPIFRVGADGLLTATGDALETPSPVCMKFLIQPRR
jgi:6-phosphogluconolactonase